MLGTVNLQILTNMILGKQIYKDKNIMDQNLKQAETN